MSDVSLPVGSISGSRLVRLSFYAGKQLITHVHCYYRDVWSQVEKQISLSMRDEVQVFDRFQVSFIV